MYALLRISPLYASGLCALGSAVCLMLAVRNVFAGKQRKQPQWRVDAPTIGANLFAFLGVLLAWPGAIESTHRSALYAMLCYSFWFWPDWARHMLDPHLRHVPAGVRLRLSVALFGLGGLLTLLALIALTRQFIFPSAVVAGLVGLSLATVAFLGMLYVWLSALLLPVEPADTPDDLDDLDDAPLNREKQLRERRWFWRGLGARVAALLLFALAAWGVWSLTASNEANRSLVLASGFLFALVAYVVVIGVDLRSEAERTTSRAAPTPGGAAPAAGLSRNGVLRHGNENGSKEGRPAVSPETRT